MRTDTSYFALTRFYGKRVSRIILLAIYDRHTPSRSHKYVITAKQYKYAFSNQFTTDTRLRSRVWFYFTSLSCVHVVHKRCHSVNSNIRRLLLLWTYVWIQTENVRIKFATYYYFLTVLWCSVHLHFTQCFDSSSSSYVTLSSPKGQQIRKRQQMVLHVLHAYE